MRMSRRDLCKLLGLASLSGSVHAELPHSVEQVDVAVPARAHLFSLSDVKLFDSEFRRSQQLNLDYLLTLEPDRLLAWFRREAGLTPKAPVYGGWESETVWGDHYSLPGAILGFYFTSMANSYESTGDPDIRERLTYTVDQLAECQVAFGDGYLLPTKNGRQIFDRVAAGEIVTSNPLINGVWEPTYVMNKVTLGLLDVYKALGMDKAKQVLLSLADWFGTSILNKLNDEQVQRLLVCEHGSLSESFVECYRLTKSQKYLDWAKRLNDHDMLDPLSEGKDILDGWHGNTQIPKFTGFHNVYLSTGQVRFRNAAFNFWQFVTENRSWVNGGNSTGEHFFPAEQTTERMLATSGPESCNTVNMLRLTETLFTDSVDPRLADFYERALYNHILAVHEPKRAMCSYFTSMRPGHYRTYSSEFDSFWCCLGTGIQAASRYGAFIYAKGDDRLYVNLFIPSAVHWEEMGVSLRQETSFPDQSLTALSISAKSPRQFSLHVRHPWWLKTDSFKILINGELQELASRPTTYVEINRLWNDGDRIEVQLPMKLALEKLRDSNQFVAIMYGPILLAGELGHKNLETVDFYQHMDHSTNQTVAVSESPVLSGSPEQILQNIERKDPARLVFFLHCPDQDSPDQRQSISLVPLHRLHFQRYAVYWRTFADEPSRRAYRENLRNVALAIERSHSDSVDNIIAGYETSEKEHGMECVDCVTGVADEHSWRRASKGGWFSYLIALQPKTQHAVWVDYHGAEFEENAFSILIDGRPIASETNLKNLEFPIIYGKAYRIPRALVAGKSSATVKFQSKWPHPTPRIFAIRTITTT